MTLIRYLRTPLDLPLALFVVSALIGVWASYDPGTSWRKFGMIFAAVALYYLLLGLRAAPQLLMTFVWLFLFGSAALAVYFVTQHDYATEPGKFGFITAIGLFLNRLSPQLRWHVFDPNITSGALEIALPVGVAVVSSQYSVASTKSRFTFLISLFTCLLIAFGLVMTSSRGAWLALGIVGIVGTLGLFARNALKRYALPIAVMLVLLIAITVLGLGESLLPVVESLLGAVPAGNTAVSRMELFGQAWGLIQDYYFTGSGLGVFPMILSTYALLIDVPFLTHAHNLFLQIWLEQGLLGFVAFVWLVAEFAFWTVSSKQLTVNRHQSTVNDESLSHVTSHTSLTWLAWGGVAAAAVMLLHGMVDVLLYSSRGLPLMLVPMGLAVSSSQYSVVSIRYSEGGVRQSRLVIGPAQTAGSPLRYDNWKLLTVPVVLVLLSSVILQLSSFQAMWYANLGSVEQTRVELGEYRWPDRLVENIRKDLQLTSNSSTSPTDVATWVVRTCFQISISHFEQALALDPGNVTANQRLGMLALARGEFDSAQNLLERAYRRDPANLVTAHLLNNVHAR